MPAPKLARSHSGRSENGTTGEGRVVIGEDGKSDRMEVTAKDSPRYPGVQNLAADKLERMEKEAKV